MEKSFFDYLVRDARSTLEQVAKENDFYWFFEFHIREVLVCAEKLLTFYPEADRQIVILACWYHDIGHFLVRGEEEIIKIKPIHHITSAEFAQHKLQHTKIGFSTIDRIAQCILRHRNLPEYPPATIEEKIVACADASSHFYSLFYLTYFKLHPNKTLEEFVQEQLAKIERDWRDAQLLPEGKELVETQYNTLKQMLLNYQP